MKIKNIIKVGTKKVYDLSVKDAEHYILENGVVTHNTGIYYSSDTIFIIGRQQEKEGTEVVGYNFIINVEKSRFVKEKSKIPISVSFDGGISTWSGLMDLALESGHCIKPKNGWYAKVNISTGEIIEKNYRLKDTDNKAFWSDILKDEKFKSFIEGKYKMSSGNMINVDILDKEISDVFNDTDDD